MAFSNSGAIRTQSALVPSPVWWTRTLPGEISSSVQKFTTIFGPSAIFLALAGYAVLDDTAMPVVGPTTTGSLTRRSMPSRLS